MRISQIVAYLDSTSALDLDARSPWTGRAGPDEALVRLRTGPLLAAATDTGEWTPPASVIAQVVAPLVGSDHIDTPASTPRWDADAWYRPVHTCAYDSGIVVRETAVVALARGLASSSSASRAPLPPTAETARWLLRAGFVVLYLHQHFHHRVEMLGLRMEVVEQRPRYVPYYREAYAGAAGTDDQLEEALANAYVVRMLNRRAYTADVPVAVRRLATDLVRRAWEHDAPGYRTAGAWLTPDAWDKGLGELHARVQEATVRPSRRATWRHLGPDLTGSFLDPAQDVFVTVGVGADPALPRDQRAMPGCTAEQMLRILGRAGYEPVRRQRGTHTRLTCKGRAVAVLPSSGPLSPGQTTRLLELVDAVPADLPTLLGGG